MSLHVTTEANSNQVNDAKDFATSASKPVGGRSEKTRQDIIDAAGQLFADQGFKATTISQICKAADVNQAAVSFHFGGREQLYIDLVRYGFEYVESEIPWPTGEPGTTATTKLQHFVLTFLRRSAAN